MITINHKKLDTRIPDSTVPEKVTRYMESSQKLKSMVASHDAFEWEEAILNRNPDKLKNLLQTSAILSQIDKEGNTPLNLAFKCWSENKEKAFNSSFLKIFKVLLKYNPDPNVPNFFNLTPLFYAIHKESHEWVKGLIKLGAQLNIQDHDGATPLHHIVRQELYNSQQASEEEYKASAAERFLIMRTLLEEGGNMFIIDHTALSPWVLLIKEKDDLNNSPAFFVDPIVTLFRDWRPHSSHPLTDAQKTLEYIQFDVTLPNDAPFGRFYDITTSSGNQMKIRCIVRPLKAADGMDSDRSINSKLLKEWDAAVVEFEKKKEGE